ncbi:MAG TPA: metallopeptidase TldD-related protein [Aestuariivirgaceae bacterium]|nr:metallopeptidase TldD-related protein [Aestuariivirgaceae bacterium]
MTEQRPLLDIAQDAIARARRLGADAADVLVVSGEATEVEIRDDKIESVERSEGRDLGLRVFIGQSGGQSSAIVSASRFEPDDLEAAAERAVAMARAAPPDPFGGLADEKDIARDVSGLDMADGAAPSTEDLLALARAAEAAGLAVSGVTKSSGASASASRRAMVLVASNGFTGSYARTDYGVSASLIAGSGTAMERDYDYSAAVHFADLDPAERIGRQAGDRTVRRLGARKVASQRVPVIFDRRVAGGLMGHLAQAVVGSAITRATSFLKDRMGDRLFKPGTSVIDDARLPRGRASKPFDGEGLPTGRLPVIEDGTLKTWLLDCRSARQLKLASTGHASRGIGGPPSPSPSNLYLEAGTISRDALIGTIANGFLVTELMGTGVNPVTGDYSRGAAGFWIENGELAYPVSEVTIAGNLKDMFLALTPADDLEFRGTINAPTSLVGEMTVAGT